MNWTGSFSEITIVYPEAWSLLVGLTFGVLLGWLARTKPLEGDVVDALARCQIFYERLRLALYHINRMTGDEKITAYIRDVQKMTRASKTIGDDE